MKQVSLPDRKGNVWFYKVFECFKDHKAGKQLTLEQIHNKNDKDLPKKGDK